MSTVPPVMSSRNHCHSAATAVEDGLRFLPESYKTPEFQNWLLRYTETLVRLVAMDFAKGAERGIEQAAKLICDPDYYATLKERRRKRRKSWEESQRRQEAEIAERRQCPTAQQLMSEVAHLEEWIPREEARVAHMKERLEFLKKLKPKNIRIVDFKRGDA